MVKVEWSSSMVHWSYNLRTRIVDCETGQFSISDAFSFQSFVGTLSTGSKQKLLKFFRRHRQYSQSNEFVTCLIARSQDIPTYFRFVAWISSQETLAGFIEPIAQSHYVADSATIVESLVSDSRKGMFVCDSNCTVLEANNAFLESLNLKPIECIGKDIRSLNLLKNAKKLLGSMRSSFQQEQHWLGYIEYQRRLGEHAVHELEIDKVNLSAHEFIYVGRLSISSHANITEDNIYSLEDVHILSEQEFYAVARDRASTQCLSVLMSLQPDFCRSSYMLKLRILAIAMMHTDLNWVVGTRNDTSLLVLLDSDSTLYEKGGFAKSIRSFKRTLKRYVDESIYRDVQNGFVGADVYGLGESSIDEVIDHSIKAMMTHDRREANINFYEQSQFENSVRTRKIEKEVIEAVRTSDIDVHFQPIVSLKTGRIEKFEALCRFNTAGGDYSVQELISTAESLGVVHAIDKMVCSHAIELFSELVPLSTDKLSLSINCSLADHEQGSQYLSDMYRLINAAKYHDFDITIEITESNYFGSAVENSALINAMRQAGIGIAVDDFGTGSSSFSYFNDFTFDVLKIDREFIQDIHLIKHKFFAVKMLTELSHALGIKVVAEGVELEEELNVVKGIGVDYVQGFIFSRPLPISEYQKRENINQVLQYKELDMTV
ncbi:EAL domain-containing protein [Vibrio maerlii]|uniref:sensor domain-containing phosphodiesterase n=1 Tax=Vibrio maerlii TaxID=2231648 RepID=UPI000E3C0446|nr:EAL domain-containing protein [Vibrio maerlii]